MIVKIATFGVDEASITASTTPTTILGDLLVSNGKSINAQVRAHGVNLDNQKSLQDNQIADGSILTITGELKTSGATIK